MAISIDLQTHSAHSPDCGWMEPERLVARAVAAGLDGIAVTDHNTMAGYSGATAAAPQGFLVIPGEEIDTLDGQLIGLFLSREIEPMQPAHIVIDEIHSQDGLVVTPHPFDRFRSGLRDLESHRERIDAIETLNGRCVLNADNARAVDFAKQYGLPQVGGSDAHFPREVGSTYTVIGTTSTNPRDVRNAILTGQAEPVGTPGSVLNHGATKLLKLSRRLRRYQWPSTS